MCQINQTKNLRKKKISKINRYRNQRIMIKTSLMFKKFTIIIILLWLNKRAIMIRFMRFALDGEDLATYQEVNSSPKSKYWSRLCMEREKHTNLWSPSTIK